MPASNDDMKKLLARALFDPDFRESLTDDPKGVARSAKLDLAEDQVRLLTEVSERLRAIDVSKVGGIEISVERKLDFRTGNPIGPVAGHGSTSVSW